MHWRSRIWPALLVSCAALISFGCRTSRSTDAGITQADQHSAIVHAAGTVATIEEQAHDEQSYDLLPGPRVCFTIDSFAQIPTAVRNAYESAERERRAEHGPRCRDTVIDPSAVRIKVGDRVEIYLRLENAGQISIVRVSWRGVDL